MGTWNTYLTKAIALHARGKNMENSLHFTKLFNKDLPPSKLAETLQQAQEIKDIYSQAYRMIKLLQDIQPEDSTTDIGHVEHMIESSIRRMDDVLKILNFKARKWGFQEKDDYEQMPPTVRQDQLPVSKRVPFDNSYADDNLKSQVKHSLQELADVVDYLEKPTLLKIHRMLKLVNH